VNLISDILFWVFSVAAVVTGLLVFITDSMVRAAYWLMASFVAVGGILMILDAQFLGLILILMMAGEMTIMAIFMVMFMMNPAGLNPMRRGPGPSWRWRPLGSSPNFRTVPSRPVSIPRSTSASSCWESRC